MSYAKPDSDPNSQTSATTDPASSNLPPSRSLSPDEVAKLVALGILPAAASGQARAANLANLIVEVKKLDWYKNLNDAKLQQQVIDEVNELNDKDWFSLKDDTGKLDALSVVMEHKWLRSRLVPARGGEGPKPGAPPSDKDAFPKTRMVPQGER
jgi:hypothetical protein